MFRGTLGEAENALKTPCSVDLSKISGNALAIWVSFVVFGLWVYHGIAQREFTSIATLSVIAQALSFVLLHMQISTCGSVAGISGKTVIMHIMKLCCRIGASLWIGGYLPVDNTGDWLYNLIDVVSLLMAIRILFCIHVSHKSSYQKAEDAFEVRNLILGAVVLAVLIHPRFCQWTACDILWTVHLYIDAIAMVPQIWMVSKGGGKMNALTAHYIAATLMSNLLGFVFWFYASESFSDGYGDAYGKINITGLAVNGAHVVQVLLLLDFGYFYGRACLQGQGLTRNIGLYNGYMDF